MPVGQGYPNVGTAVTTNANLNMGGQSGIGGTGNGGTCTFPGRGEPMDLDQARGCAGPIKCYNCGEMGHISRNCTKPKEWQTARAMFESLVDEQKKEVAEIFRVRSDQAGNEGFQESQE